jgi:hypothetical protein
MKPEKFFADTLSAAEIDFGRQHEGLALQELRPMAFGQLLESGQSFQRDARRLVGRLHIW